jgi:hypothetical protein
MNYKTRTNHNSHPGVTLLFTISMIVLFLLMGTTFVVVANDYYKTAVRRSRLNTYKVNATALLDRAFNDVFRGPSLSDISSPLRGHSILEDQYGYGYTTTLTNALAGPVGALKTLVIKNPDPTVPPILTNIRGDGTAVFDWSTYVNGIFNGRVITISAGVGGDRYSSRIVSHFLVDLNAGGGGPPEFELRVVVPTDELGLAWTGANSVASEAMAGNIEVIINGRDFSGFGAGDVTGAPNYDYDYGTGPLATLIGVNALQPNRVGESRADLIAADGYLEFDNSPNETYDIPGEQNMFLSGNLPAPAGTELYRPSFHSDTLYDDQVAGGESPSFLRRRTFRPVFVRDTGTMPIAAPGVPGSTAREAFGFFADDGSIPATETLNSVNGLDVDSDGDGENDAVWIDIGLPLQTDEEGRRFRPLVAYRIIDMDGRLNVNAHGSYADEMLGAAPRRGSSYGVAEISLRDVVGTSDYGTLLNNRSGDESPAVPGNSNNLLGIAQNLFGYSDATVVAGNLFGTGSDIFARSVIERGVTTFGEEGLPAFVAAPALTGSAQISAYAADLGIGGGVGDSLFQAFEIEPLLRSHDVDNALLESRLRGLGSLATNIDSITTDSAEIAMPPESVIELLRDAIAARQTASGDGADFDTIVALGYLSNDVLMGGKFDLNQPTGNGVDDDGDNIIDDPEELGSVAQVSSQHNSPTFDLDNQGNSETGDALARQRKAMQLYTLTMLVVGDTPPPYVLAAGVPAMTTIEYRTAVAQWAINVVDYSDTDSIRTVFEFDLNPFNNIYVDGNPATTTHSTLGTAEAPDAAIVFGLERPELVFNETSATHDRRNTDSSTDNGGGDDVAGGDLDWDSGYIPETSAFIELYNPHAQTDTVNTDAATGFQVNPAELDVAQEGVDLSLMAPMSSPVWRIGVKRVNNPLPAEPFVRGIFFTDPSAAPAGVTFPGDNFYPSYTLPSGGGATVHKVTPGGYFVVGSSGNVPGEHRVTYGRLNGNIPSPATTRSISLDNSANPGLTSNEWDGTTITPQPKVNCGIAVIDMPRSLSLSDPNDGYDPIVAAEPTIMTTPEADATLLTPARDTPLDSGADALDVAAIWNNGVTDGFRYLYLQRLADPTQAFDMTTNPYITVDVTKVDLLAFNGMDNNPVNDVDTSDPMFEPERSASQFVTDGSTQFRTVERGEEAAMLPTTADGIAEARRTRLRTEEGITVTADEDPADTTKVFAGIDGHNLSYKFNHTLGELNASHTAASPVGWMVWNNRPFANAMELVHVPFSSTENLLDRFNYCRAIDGATALTAASEPEEVFAYYMSDDKFGHLIGYGGMSPMADGVGETGGATTPLRRAPTFANRFDRIFDFVGVPSRFLGSKTFLPSNVAASPTMSGLTFNMYAPYNTLPNFREPGKVNANTVNESDVYDAVQGGFAAADIDFDEFQLQRIRPDGALNDVPTGPVDFEGIFIPATSSQYVHDNALPNGAAGLFRRDPTALADRVFDFDSGDPATNSESSSWFENEFRQRLESATTTRSSVFSIWITIGYFEVDEFGRVGQEIGSDEGQVRRNRAFYMVDRSVPVACEPGKNHNVDEAVLVRTIIE